jgi:peptidoglycan LD-endopeptidase CwlK
MASRKIEDLTIILRTKAKYLIEYFKPKDIDILITCTHRPVGEQNALYYQGRLKLSSVNKLRKESGLYLLSSEKENKIVTNCKGGESKHNLYPSEAFDFVVVENGKCIWTPSDSRWTLVGKKGIDIGLDWAGSWKKFKEMAHFQMTVSKTNSSINNTKEVIHA